VAAVAEQEAEATGVPRAAARTSLTHRPWSSAVFGVLGTLTILVVLELLVRVGVFSSEDVPPVSDVLRVLGDEVRAGELWQLVWDTTQQWALGLGVAMCIGIPLGLAMGSNEYLARSLRPTIEFLRPVPGVALIPVVILVFGLGMQGTTFLIAFGSVWPLLIQSMYGVREIDPVTRDMARSFGFNWLERVRFVVVPSALAFIATGLRVASSVALIIAVTAELVIGVPGLGKSIGLAQSSGAVPQMYALVLATGLLGVVIHLVFRIPERRLLKWHPSQRVDTEL